jgi:type VI secretion system protein ImpM
LRGEALAAALRWWALAAQAALEGLEGDLDALSFDAVLERVFVAAAAADAAADVRGALESVVLPAAGASLWLGDPSVKDGVRMLCAGLPRDLQFDSLFLGFAGEG